MILPKIFRRNDTKYKSLENSIFGIGVSLDYNFELGCTYVREIFCEDLEDKIKKGDIILEINDKDVIFYSIYKIREMILGEYDSEVKILFYRDKERISHTFKRTSTV